MHENPSYTYCVSRIKNTPNCISDQQTTQSLTLKSPVDRQPCQNSNGNGVGHVAPKSSRSLDGCHAARC